MNIALLHFRVGETDGVSLEMAKWQRVLCEQGHRVMFLSGSPGSQLNVELPSLHYQHPRNLELVKRAYEDLGTWTETDLQREIIMYADEIEMELRQAILDYEIDILVPNNLWSLGWNLSAGLALNRIAQTEPLTFIAHHHDFFWERERYAHPTSLYVRQLLGTVFPPRLPNVRHVTINEIARHELFSRRDLNSFVIPNVFDFTADPWLEDEYNSDFRELIGAKDTDIVFLQATRITERKGIELGIEVAARVAEKVRDMHHGSDPSHNSTFSPDTHVWFVLAGMKECQDDYYNYLLNKGNELGLSIVDVGGRIRANREILDGIKYYSLWDAYVHANIISYPSLLEGWGNQFLEALFAKKPILLYEYPVFTTDIKDKGFHYISLGSNHSSDMNGRAVVSKEVVGAAAEECFTLLADKNRCHREVEENFRLGYSLYSLASLSGILESLFKGVLS